MTIRPSLPPRSHSAAIAERISALAVIPGDHVVASWGSRAFDITTPHPVYSLPFSAISVGELDSARLVGWRYLITQEGAVLGAAEIGPSGGASTIAVAGDRYASAMVEAIDRVAVGAELTSGSFDVRLLRINSLMIVAVWFAGDDQFIVPLRPAPAFLDADELYTEDSFFDALQQAATRPFERPR